ncbi:MAG: hypothetical protein RL264_2271 [Bacteroidota bacterium]|jgi:oligoendopeptidase F
MNIERAPRIFLAEDLLIENWADIEMYFSHLENINLDSAENLVDFLRKKSELDAVLEEDQAWRYIHMSISTNDEEKRKRYTHFVQNIQPEITLAEDRLVNKLLSCEHLETLKENEAYRIYLRSVEVQQQLFREENVALEAYLGETAQQYGAISGAQTIEHEGKVLTLQQASQLLKVQDETVRKTVFEKIANRRREDIDKLNALYSDLLQKRHQIAINAGLENYRDYKFLSLNRFDYTKEDCFNFHEAIAELVVPLVKKIQAKKLEKMGKTKFKPWDLEVDPEGKPALSPFKSGKEMLDGTIRVFSKIDSYFADCLSTMEAMGHLDLESKTGKAPGGYNYPLYEIGVPFIFMNAVGAQRDLVTMVHEGGHAIHSFLTRDLTLTGFKNVPSEVAELASMSMELLSMKFWDDFYINRDDFKRAQLEHLQDILKVLPWIAQIDAFQHWIYENPTHSAEERVAFWMKLNQRFGTGLTDWTGFEDMIAHSWQRQLHLFELPFYYIEYGIAQLGALGVWMNSKQDYEKAVSDYKAALSLGYTVSMPKIYATANVKFDFSLSHLQELVGFIEKEIEKLELTN